MLCKLHFDFGQPRENVPLMVELAVERDGFTGYAFYPVSDRLVELNMEFLRNMVSSSAKFGSGGVYSKLCG